MTRDDSARFSDVNPGWLDQLIFGREKKLSKSYSFSTVVGRRSITREPLDEEEYRKCELEQKQMPTLVMVFAPRNRAWWWFRDEFYYHSSEEDDPEVIKGLILQKWARDAKRREKARKVAREDFSSN